METNKSEILENLRNALTFLGQAQEKVHPMNPLFDELGDLYDEIDSVIQSVDCGDYDDRDS
jgi:hypothetical protein